MSVDTSVLRVQDSYNSEHRNRCRSYTKAKTLDLAPRLSDVEIFSRKMKRRVRRAKRGRTPYQPEMVELGIFVIPLLFLYMEYFVFNLTHFYF